MYGAWEENSTMLAVAVFCIVCTVCWLLRRNNVNTKEPPCYPGAWPILGHLPLFREGSSKILDVLNHLAKHIYDLGGVATLKIGPLTIYTIADPDDFYTVSSTCLEKDPFYDFGKAWLGDGLVTARGLTWKNHRKLLNPAFNQTLLDTFMGVFNSQAKKLVKEFEKEVGKGPFDHVIYIKYNTLESICLTSLGIDFTDANLNDEYFKAFELIFEAHTKRFLKFWLHNEYTYAWSSLKRQEDACLKILHNMSNTVLQNKKKSMLNKKISTERNSTGTKFKPFIDLILELAVEKGAFTDKQIRDHVDTMLVAGHDTTAHVLLYTMILLGSHPVAQEKLFVEIQEVLGMDRDVEKADLSKLVYLEAVLKESMRFYTIGTVQGRKLDRDVKLKKYTLSAGRTCVLLQQALHMHPIWGPDAHEFHPERWLEPGRLPDNPYVYAPFSLGKRNCIGKAYAMMSMKTTLIHVVRRYRIQADHTKMQLKYDVMLKPESGYYISIQNRS